MPDLETKCVIVKGAANMERKIESILDNYQRDRGLLVSILQDIQAECNYLPKEALVQVSKGLDIPLSWVYSVATFFKSFSLQIREKEGR